MEHIPCDILSYFTVFEHITDENNDMTPHI